ncbi:MAG: hypothetical protein CMQ75_01945 [Gammaproteobacteria bacterium]|nr:hypothetical protein [Gammaproteobacteria bacterium]RPG99556.1 MAG: hypothetical protein CBC78_002145 [Candidatus Pelagibacter sp. TMED118]|tara:strand:- start:1750 stop:1989 length:240 start_codon:yes stop_codon:yes gene_type:complete
MALNGISTLQYKRDRQDQKLALASTDRTDANTVTPGRYAVTSVDATELPTRYASNDNTHSNIIDNPNTGGLKNGRPFAP